MRTGIFRADEGYRLDWTLRNAPDETPGSVYASDPLRLGRALARRLVARLLPAASPEVDGFRLHDPWAMRVFAHAMQAAAEGAWIRARNMLSVVLDLEPDYADARREFDRIAPFARASEPPHETGGVVIPRS